METWQKAIIVVGIIIVIAIFLGPGIFRSTAPAAIPYVTVSGSVTTVGLGTHPISIDFTSDNGQIQTATVSGGSYSVELQNQHSYTMTVHYSAGLNLITNTCNGGSLPVFSSSSSLQHDISC